MPPRDRLSTEAPISVQLPDAPLPPSKPRKLRRVLLAIGVVVAVVIVVGLWLVYRALASVNTVQDGSNKKIGIIEQVGKILTSGQEKLDGEEDDRVNILLLGIGGPGHDGPYLTDTILVASYQPSTKRVSLLSIPRDLVVNIPDYGFRKINNVLSIGRDQEYPGGGEALAVKVVSDILNIPIQYYARVDFSGFSKIIDRVGGIDITVDTSFTDREYPTENYGYQTIRFTKGPAHLSGDLALKFARSRHGNNGEGSDFARAERQQKILTGLKEKLLSAGTLANPKKISDIISELGTHSQTNMEIWEMLRFAKLADDITTDQIVNRVIQDGENGLVHAARGQGGAFILEPNDESYGDIRFLTRYIFAFGQATEEKANVLIINASKVTGMAGSAVDGLKAFGLSLLSPLSWKGSPVLNTTIIDASGGTSPATIGILERYRQSVKTMTPAEWTTETQDQTLLQILETASRDTKNPAPDIVLILGQDQAKK